MPRVLVTDGNQRSALAVVRSLGQAGHEVIVTGHEPSTVAGASRYAAGYHRLPRPAAGAGTYLPELERVVDRERPDVLIPISETSLTVILPRRGRFPDVSIPFPDASTFRLVSDKETVLELASETGISVPKQHVVAGPESVSDTELADLGFPVVVKPYRSVAESSGGMIEVGISYANDRAELNRRLRELPDRAYPVLLQERIVGPGVGIFLLVGDGEVLGLFAHRRIREKPPSGGVSVYRESVPADPDLVDRSRALLGRCDWQGVGMVEYKIRRETGEPYLMEINGRFWGSLQLAIDAGVDFPRLLVDVALGGSPGPVRDYRTGVRSRWLWGDVDHLLARLRGSPESLHLPDDAPGRLRALASFLRFSTQDRLEVLRLSDPRPFLVETKAWVRDLLRSSVFRDAA